MVKCVGLLVKCLVVGWFYICGATPKGMTDIDVSVNKQLDSLNYQFGLAPFIHKFVSSNIVSPFITDT